MATGTIKELCMKQALQARSAVSSPASGHQQAHATEKTQPYVTNARPKDESPVDFPLVQQEKDRASAKRGQ
jgi:hypothetical protein